MQRCIYALVVASLALATPSEAQTPDQDVRCILVSNFFSAVEKDPVKRNLAVATSMFFAGRADARIPASQLRALVTAQGRLVTAGTASATMNQCAKAFQAKVRVLQAIGRQVAQSQKGAPPPNPAKR